MGRITAEKQEELDNFRKSIIDLFDEHVELTRIEIESILKCGNLTHRLKQMVRHDWLFTRIEKRKKGEVSNKIFYSKKIKAHTEEAIETLNRIFGIIEPEHTSKAVIHKRQDLVHTHGSYWNSASGMKSYCGDMSNFPASDL